MKPPTKQVDYTMLQSDVEQARRELYLSSALLYHARMPGTTINRGPLVEIGKRETIRQG